MLKIVEFITTQIKVAFIKVTPYRNLPIQVMNEPTFAFPS